MDLSRYEKMMERRMERTAFPISETELCRRYEKLYTGAVNDVARRGSSCRRSPTASCRCARR